MEQEVEKKSSLKLFLSLIFFVVVVLLLVFYWFIPIKTIEFDAAPINSNFSLNSYDKNMQFYENMRFPNPRISYKIYDCSLQKKNDMNTGFDMIADFTILDFYPVVDGEEISITCDSKQRFEDGLFIAGEGGPTNITQVNQFNVILNGKILLIKKSQCPIPNIAIHELLHVLGFEHSLNKNNIMYNFSSCKQTIGEDIPNLVNKLYAIQSYPDLVFENVSAVMNGKYLDLSINIRNNGLSYSENSKILVYADNDLIKEIDLKKIDIGYGMQVSFENLWIGQLSVNEIKVLIENDFNELDKQNNEIVLKIKK